MHALTASSRGRSFPKLAIPEYEPDDLQLLLRERQPLTADVTTYVFEVARADGQPFRHHPGQSLTIELADVGAEGCRRTFTIASSGGAAGRAELTVKAGPHAHATRWMHDSLRPGDRLSARGPFGRFSLVHAPVVPLLLIGGGSGMTPVMSMLRWLAERGHDHDVVLLQIARMAEDLLFAAELEAIGAKMPRLKVHLCLTRPAPSWAGISGHLTRSLLRRIAPDAPQRVAFCCGPAPLMEAARAVYLAEGGAASAFVTETFGGGAGHQPGGPIRLRETLPRAEPRPVAIAQTPTAAPVPPVAEVASPSPLAVAEGDHAAEFRGTRFAVAAGQSILSAAAEAGLRIPTSCGQGTCGTCKVRLVSGQVDMRDQGGLGRKDRAAGYILACCSYPQTDVVLSDR